MACARPESTPNPDAMKFTLDVTLPDRLLANRGDDVDDPFVRALLAIDGVASIFGINGEVPDSRAANTRNARQLAPQRLINGSRTR